ncbi:MAG: GntR family transcriptional regulator [Isosphaera sp.]|nr:GntR family transcriptional regulator [Isosphaera sp.]
MAARPPARSEASAPARGLLKDQAYDRIKQRLLSDEYPPGTFLSERQLAEGLGMSKTPVKAALERLEAEGFIAVSPQQGIVVRELSVREIADQYEIRAALESYALRTLAGTLTADQVARVRENLAAQARLRGTGDVAAGVELDAAFHTQFVEFLGNREISRALGRLREKMRQVVTRVFRLSPARIDTSHDEHVAIADAVIGGDGPRAADLVVRHLELGKQLILSPRG